MFDIFEIMISSRFEQEGSTSTQRGTLLQAGLLGFLQEMPKSLGGGA